MVQTQEEKLLLPEVRLTPTLGGMTISELAKRAGVNLDTIRYYERRKLLPDPRPRGKGYRDYDESHVRRVTLIKQAKALGFTLTEITQLLSQADKRGLNCGDLRARGEKKLADLDAQIAQLQQFRGDLADLIERCPDDYERSCDVTKSLDPSCCAS